MADPSNALSHWSNLIEGFQIPPQEFYGRIHAAVEQRKVPDVNLSTVEHKEGGAFSANRLYLRAQRGHFIFDLCGAPFGTGFFTSWWLVEKKSRLGLLYLAASIVVLCTLWTVLFGVVALATNLPTATVFSFFALPFCIVVGIPLIFWFVGAVVATTWEGVDDVMLSIPFIGSLYNYVFKPITYYKHDTAEMFQMAIHAAVLQAIDEVTKDKGIRALSELERKPIMKSLSARA